MLLRKFKKRRTSLFSRRAAIRRGHSFETLEARQLLAGDAFNDPEYTTNQWGLNNTGQIGGLYDIDIDAPEAWTISTGSMKTVLAQVDDGVDFTHPDIYLNIWLNQDEIPSALRPNLTDTDSDALITFRDLNSAANETFVADLNNTGYIDGGDLLIDSQWENGVDDDGNGKVDDLVGWDFVDGDNDPRPLATEGHGTGMVQWVGAIPNNGIGKVGVNHFISAMPVRARQGDVTTVDPLKQAAGIDYAVAEGAAISGVWGRKTEFSQGLYDAIERARLVGHLVVAPAGNDGVDLDAAPQYPAALNLENIISVTSFNSSDGKDPYWNWGATSVDLAGPTAAPSGGTSGGAAHVSAVAALLKTVHPDWNYAQIKDRILSSVEPSTAFAGKTVTGGRLNAARAVAETSISISDPTIIEADSGMTSVAFTVTRFGDSTGDIVLNWSTEDRTAIAGSDYVPANGQILFVAGGENSQTVTVQIAGDLIVESKETFYVSLVLVSGSALLADARGQMTIHDDDGPIFYVVDDGSTDKTYEYNSLGNPAVPFSLDLATRGPRGAASTIAGDRLWIVDANRNVFVYGSAGGLLGLWSAGSLSSNSQVQGIATNGTDVWIVDAGADTVFRYAGAASRLSGTQNAANSFKLNKQNKNPTGIETDGTYLWVVDNSSIDKVFKYTLSGSLVGSWTISGGGGSPTGVTIDPSNVSDIWIVDNASDRVYQFTAAASRTSGSQAPATSFALTAGNTNPQGIADPPAAGAQALLRETAFAGNSAELRKRADRHSPTVDCQPARSRAYADLRMALDFVFNHDLEFGQRRLRKAIRS